ncbi:MAG: hypothetical protein IT426_14445 [Pirellulales bacterium]|nr:hypothetical protein [Pirellulales bacterium]
MSTRQLTLEELAKANHLLDEIRSNLDALCNGDKELLFAYRRKIKKELEYDERGKPTDRRKLKDQKWKEQRGMCSICGKELPEKYTVLDRINAMNGYTKENTRLVHQECDIAQQAARGYA